MAKQSILGITTILLSFLFCVVTLATFWWAVYIEPNALCPEKADKFNHSLIHWWAELS